MSDDETLRVYDAKAQEYAERFCQGLAPDDDMRSFLEAVPPGAAVLDLGCGPGRSAAIMAAAGHDVTATDASAEMVKIAAAQEGVRAYQATFDALNEVARYDGIWANFSLLHADRADLPRHLKAIAVALKPGGIFHIGMKTGTGQKRDAMGRLYTYVEDAELSDLLEAAGLQVFMRRSGAEVGLAGTKDPFLIVQARKDA